MDKDGWFCSSVRRKASRDSFFFFVDCEVGYSVSSHIMHVSVLTVDHSGNEPF